SETRPPPLGRAPPPPPPPPSPPRLSGIPTLSSSGEGRAAGAPACGSGRGLLRVPPIYANPTHPLPRRGEGRRREPTAVGAAAGRGPPLPSGTPRAAPFPNSTCCERKEA